MDIKNLNKAINEKVGRLSLSLKHESSYQSLNENDFKKLSKRSISNKKSREELFGLVAKREELFDLKNELFEIKNEFPKDLELSDYEKEINNTKYLVVKKSVILEENSSMIDPSNSEVFEKPTDTSELDNEETLNEPDNEETPNETTNKKTLNKHPTKKTLNKRDNKETLNEPQTKKLKQNTKSKPKNKKKDEIETQTKTTQESIKTTNNKNTNNIYINNNISNLNVNINNSPTNVNTNYKTPQSFNRNNSNQKSKKNSIISNRRIKIPDRTLSRVKIGSQLEINVNEPFGKIVFMDDKLLTEKKNS